MPDFVDTVPVDMDLYRSYYCPDCDSTWNAGELDEDHDRWDTFWICPGCHASHDINDSEGESDDVLGCGACGAALSLGDFDDMDDLRCPECGSEDIYSPDDEASVA